jgi:hypothetical protein
LLASRGILGGDFRPQADCDQQQYEVYLIDGDLPLMILSSMVRSLALVSLRPALERRSGLLGRHAATGAGSHPDVGA